LAVTAQRFLHVTIFFPPQPDVFSSVNRFVMSPPDCDSGMSPFYYNISPGTNIDNWSFSSVSNTLLLLLPVLVECPFTGLPFFAQVRLRQDPPRQRFRTPSNRWQTFTGSNPFGNVFFSAPEERTFSFLSDLFHYCYVGLPFFFVSDSFGGTVPL